jgi:hypothetical protein
MKKILVWMPVALMLIAGGCKKDDKKSAACDILSFTVDGTAWKIGADSITFVYPQGTAPAMLTPVITLSPGATVYPPSGTAQDFSNGIGVTYTVTAENDIYQKKYVAKAFRLIDASGVTGDCTWTLSGITGNATLTISGSGAMDDYEFIREIYRTTAPWDEYRKDITTVVIREGVTAIGNQAFYHCSGLTGTLTIPNSVTAIGDGAFEGCGLSGVMIGHSVETIGDEAFQYCYSLTGTLTIPNSVETVGSSAFATCSGLTGVTISNSITAIGAWVFDGCSNLTEINVNDGNLNYSSADGVLFNKNKTEIVIYPAGKTGNYAIPNSVTIIGYRAFVHCRGLTGVDIPHSVKTVGSYAFQDCTGLTGTLTIPQSVTAIDKNAFYGCSDLTGVDIPHSVETIIWYAFAGCSKLSTVTNRRSEPQNIDSNVFENTNIKNNGTLRVPAGSVTAYMAAEGWKDFKNTVEIN